MAFRSATWFDVTATLEAKSATFEASLDTVNGTALATGKSFDAAGQLESKTPVEMLSEASATSIARRLTGGALHVDAAHPATPAPLHDVIAADRSQPKASLRPRTH